MTEHYYNGVTPYQADMVKLSGNSEFPPGLRLLDRLLTKVCFATTYVIQSRIAPDGRGKQARCYRTFA
eukprot:scaffold194689_cov43-Prasinocladus_malaysianus.AAC.2